MAGYTARTFKDQCYHNTTGQCARDWLLLGDQECDNIDNHDSGFLGMAVQLYV